MRILAIESSCDETAASVVESGNRVLSSVVASQIEVHKKFGGVVPEIAAREHLRLIDPIVREALKQAELDLRQIDAIAVTQGPGLIGALLVGISYAKGLASAKNLPLIPVNHVLSHVHGAALGIDAPWSELLDCLALVVSGGHTNLYHMSSPTDFKLVANSIDDACGECFDKVAKVLGLAYPGGPQIEKKALSGDKKKYPMPKMVEENARLSFSYSGLKTHMINLKRKLSQPLDEQEISDLSACFQEEALEHLVRKLKQAIKLHKPRSLMIAGGVAANQRFRELVNAEIQVKAYFPALKYCSDNAAMIGALAFHLYQSRPKEQFFAYDWDAFSRYQDAPS